MLSQLQQQYNFTDYEIAQLDFFFKSLFSEFTKLAIMAVLFHGQFLRFIFVIFLMTCLRLTTGGIHCKHYLTCLFTSVFYVFTVLELSNRISPPFFIQIITLLFCTFLIYKIGPISSEVHLTLEPVAVRKVRNSCIFLLIAYIVLTVLVPRHSCFILGFWVIVTHTVQLLIAYLRKRRRYLHYEEI